MHLTAVLLAYSPVAGAAGVAEGRQLPVGALLAIVVAVVKRGSRVVEGIVLSGGQTVHSVVPFEAA